MFYAKCPNCGAERKFMKKECPECGINYEDFYANQNLEWNKNESVKTDKFIDLNINIEQINGYHTVTFVDINDNVVDVKYVKEFEIAEIPSLELSEGYHFESYSIQFYWSDEKYTIQSSKSIDQLAKDSVPLFVWNYANTPILEDMIIHMVPNPIWMDAIQEASKNSYRNNIFDVLESGDLYPRKACGLLFYIYAFSLKIPYSTKQKLFFRAFKCGIQEAEKYVEYDPQYKELYKKIKTTATSYGYSSYRRSGYGNKISHEANSGSVYGEYLRKDQYEMTVSYPINRIKYVFGLSISTYSFGSDNKYYLLQMNKTTNQLELINEKEEVKYCISKEDKKKLFIVIYK